MASAGSSQAATETSIFGTSPITSTRGSAPSTATSVRSSATRSLL